jgi:hypothetical protein
MRIVVACRGTDLVNLVLWYVFWVVLAISLLGVVAKMLMHDLGRISRRETLRIPFIGEARPGDVTYPLALIELFGPYLTLGAAATVLIGFTVYVTMFAG